MTSPCFRTPIRVLRRPTIDAYILTPGKAAKRYSSSMPWMMAIRRQNDYYL
jgi:hypothetical protein